MLEVGDKLWLKALSVIVSKARSTGQRILSRIGLSRKSVDGEQACLGEESRFLTYFIVIAYVSTVALDAFKEERERVQDFTR